MEENVIKFSSHNQLGIIKNSVVTEQCDLDEFLKILQKNKKNKIDCIDNVSKKLTSNSYLHENESLRNFLEDKKSIKENVLLVLKKEDEIEEFKKNFTLNCIEYSFNKDLTNSFDKEENLEKILELFEKNFLKKILDYLGEEKYKNKYLYFLYIDSSTNEIKILFINLHFVGSLEKLCDDCLLLEKFIEQLPLNINLKVLLENKKIKDEIEKKDTENVENETPSNGETNNSETNNDKPGNSEPNNAEQPGNNEPSNDANIEKIDEVEKTNSIDEDEENIAKIEVLDTFEIREIFNYILMKLEDLSSNQTINFYNQIHQELDKKIKKEKEEFKHFYEKKKNINKEKQKNIKKKSTKRGG